MKKPQIGIKNDWEVLVVSDLHLTEAIEDEYRWDIFLWIKQTLDTYKVDKLFILGDILDKKDRHPSKLINRLVSELVLIAEYEIEITILMGNHDYLADHAPFLKFISNLYNIEYIITPASHGKDLWLPHTRTPVKDWKDINFNDYDRIFMHQSIIGARTSQFYTIEHGLPTNYFNNLKHKIFSGDIHIPQTINNVYYIGSPYPINYGDHFEGCGVLMDGTKTKRLFRKTLRKQSIKITGIEELEDLNLEAGDRIKVTLELSEHEVHSWNEYKKEVIEYCEENGIELKNVSLKKQESSELELAEPQEVHQKTHEELFTQFCNHSKLTKPIFNIGQEILAQAQL